VTIDRRATRAPRALAALVAVLSVGCAVSARRPRDGSEPRTVWIVTRDAGTARRAPMSSAPTFAVRAAGSAGPVTEVAPEHTDVAATVVGPLVSLTQSKRYAAAEAATERFVVFTPAATPIQQDFDLRVGARAIRVAVREPADAEQLAGALAREGRAVARVRCDAEGRVIAPVERTASTLAIETIDIAPWHDGAYELTLPRTQGGTATLAVDLNGAGPVVVVSSPSHTIDAQASAVDHLRVTLADPKTLGDADFVLRYRVDPSASPGTVLVEPDGDSALVGLLVHPQENDLEPIALANLTVDWGSTQVTEVRPPLMHALPRGAPLVLLARVRGRVAGPVTVTGRAGGRLRTLTVAVAASPPVQGLDALPVLWARAASADLLAAR
jgi:hypothetical protein